MEYDPFDDDEDDEDATRLDAGIGGQEVDLPFYPALARWGDFHILGRIAQGGMAEIYLARDTAGGTARHLVLKRILPEKDADEEFIQMFRQEAQIASRLYHDNICHVFECGELDGETYMTLEFVHGITLRKLLSRARNLPNQALPPRVAAHIIGRIASALDYIHQAQGVHGRPLGIIHRDVSPHNIMISYAGKVKLLDFGIAKTTTSESHTRAGVIKGKFSYLSPEQVRGEKLDPRSDQFALGICFYEALTGKRLYRRKEPMQALHAITDEPVPACVKRAPWVPIELDLIVQEMLQKEPDSRMESLGEVEATIHAYLMRTGGPVSPGEVASTIDLLFDTEDRNPLSAHSAKLTGSFPSDTGSMSLASAVHTSSMAPTRDMHKAALLLEPTKTAPESLLQGTKKKSATKKKKKNPQTKIWAGVAIFFLLVNAAAVWYLFFR